MFDQYLNLTPSYYLFNMQLSAKTLLLLCLLFIFTKQDLESIEFNGTVYNHSFENKQNITTFKVKVSNSSNYLKIEAKGFGEQTKINHIISYHKKETGLNEREQLSQSGNETTIMFLNKKQIEEDFYISIQCDKTPCNYSLALLSSEYAELSINDAISYYVTEANKEMKFKIFTDPISFFKHDTLSTKYFFTVYAIGSLEVNSTLENVTGSHKDKENTTTENVTVRNLEVESTIENSTNYTKHTNYSAYLIKLDYINEVEEFILTVNGKQGDMINIGSYFIKDEVSSKKLILTDRFVYGYLKKNLSQKICFEMPEERSSSYNYAFVGNLDKPLLTTGYFHRDDYTYIYYSCIEIPNAADYDEYVYYMQVYDSSNSKLFNSLQPQILGSSFISQLETEKNQSLFFNLVDKSFFNYEAFVLQGDLETFYIECNNFPLCELDTNSTNTTKKIYSINHFANLVLDEKKLQNISPISQKQYIILNKCKRGYFDYKCVFMNYGYSNNRKITMNKKCTYHKYLLKNSLSVVKFSPFPIDNLNGKSEYGCLIGDDNDEFDKNYYVVSIVVYSGSLDVTVEGESKTIDPEISENNKQFLFNITKNNISDAIINIKAKQNSFYSIIAIGGAKYEKITSNSHQGYLNIISSGSCVLGLKNQKENDLILSNNYYNYGSGYYYMGLKFHNCKFNVTKKIGFTTSESNVEVKDNYYQDILSSGASRRSYSINRIEENTNSKCFVNINSYKIKNYYILDSINTEEIFLMDNVAQKFIFDHSYNYIQFLYPNVEIEKDLNVEIKNPNKANFTVTYYFNNVTFNNSKNISTDKNSFTIKKNEWQNVCKENTIVCGISFGVSFIYNSQISNATFEIIASHDSINSGGSGGKIKSSNFMIYLFIGIGVVVLAAIIIIVVCIFKTKKSNEDLHHNVITTSFASSVETDKLI